MSREIRFKVWDVEENGFREEPEGRWMITSKGKLYNSENDEYYEDETKFKIVMLANLDQYSTGEVIEDYEGDVFKIKWFEDKHYICYVKWDNYEDKYCLSTPFEGQTITEIEDANDCFGFERIGNRHTNPELLTQ
jgi:hypothetical protein